MSLLYTIKRLNPNPGGADVYKLITTASQLQLCCCFEPNVFKVPWCRGGSSECLDAGVWVTQGAIDHVFSPGDTYYFMEPCGMKCCLYIDSDPPGESRLLSLVPDEACILGYGEGYPEIDGSITGPQEIDSCEECRICDDDEDCNYNGWCRYYAEGANCPSEPPFLPYICNDSQSNQSVFDCPATISYSIVIPEFEYLVGKRKPHNPDYHCPCFCTWTFPSFTLSGTITRNASGSGWFKYDQYMPYSPSIDGAPLCGPDEPHQCVENGYVTCEFCTQINYNLIIVPVTLSPNSAGSPCNESWEDGRCCTPTPCVAWHVSWNAGVVNASGTSCCNVSSISDYFVTRNFPCGCPDSINSNNKVVCNYVDYHDTTLECYPDGTGWCVNCHHSTDHDCSEDQLPPGGDCCSNGCSGRGSVWGSDCADAVSFYKGVTYTIG